MCGPGIRKQRFGACWSQSVLKLPKYGRWAVRFGNSSTAESRKFKSDLGRWQDCRCFSYLYSFFLLRIVGRKHSYHFRSTFGQSSQLWVSRAHERTVLLWSRIGPYHKARAGAVPNSAVIQTASTDHYEWTFKAGADVVTLIQGEDYASIDVARIRRAVQRALVELNPSTVAINGWSMPEARAALRWCKKSGATAILMSETQAADKRRLRWKEWAKGFLVRRFDVALVGGPSHADYLVSLGFSRDRIFFGYDAVDNDYFASRSNEVRLRCDQVRKDRALPEDYFFACTRFLPRKNVDGLLMAYLKYRNLSDSPWDLVIAGSGETEAQLRRQAASMNGVHWPGFLQYEELPDFFALAKAFVHVAHSEAWGLVVNEAAASGLPIVCSSVCGAAQTLVKDGENGYHVDSHNVQQIAQAMLRMEQLASEDRQTMGRRSVEIVSNWGPRRFATGLQQAIKYASA